MLLVPVGKRQRGVRRQAIEAKIKTVKAQGQHERDERAAAGPSIGSIVRVSPRPGAWRNIVAGSAAAAAIIALVSFVIIPRLQSPIEHAQMQEQGSPTVVPELPASASAPETRTSSDNHVDPTVNVAPVSIQPAKRDDSGLGESEGRWRVVIYSYSHAIDAQRRVQLISADHPGVQAHVYSPNVNGPYLVVTGDAMSRAEANRMRDRVVELGMPESTRIESFKD